MILHRIEATLDMEQPQEQNGFPARRRMKEHVFATNLILDKNKRFNLPLWMVSLDLSKTFDWEYGRDQHVSN